MARLLKSRKTIPATLLVLLLLFTGPLGHAATFTFNVDVAPGKWKGARLKNLPKGAVISCRIESTGSIAVALVKAKALKGTHPLFAGRLERELTFSVEIPETDNYVLVLDNRKQTEKRSVKIVIQAKPPAKGGPAKSDAKTAL